jgi:GlpG protein
MRQIGTLKSEQDARRFAAHLTAQGVSANAEQDRDGWVIWVRDEDHLEEAKDELQKFKLDPTDRRYRSAERDAEAVRREEAKKREQASKNVVVMRGRWGSGMGRSRKTPLVFVLIVLSVAVGMLTGLESQPTNSTLRQLEFSDSIHRVDETWNGDAFAEVRQGQVWRLITPMFLHFGAMHLVFNMYMLYYLGAQVEDRRGTVTLAVLVLVIAAASNLAQALIVGPWFGGMSGVDYGLFAYVWMKTMYEPGAGMYVSPMTALLLIGWLFLGILMPEMHMANAAHGAGLVAGAAIGYAPVLWSAIRGR